MSTAISSMTGEMRDERADSSTESMALAIAQGIAKDECDTVVLLSCELSSIPRFRKLIATLPKNVSPQHFSSWEDGKVDDSGHDLRWVIAQVFLAGVLHGKLFDSTDILAPYRQHRE